MAIHTYVTLAREFPDVTFSYIDTRRVALSLDHIGARPEVRFPLLDDAHLRALIQLELKEVAELHGYASLTKAHPTHDQKVLQAIAAIHADPDSFLEWRRWLGANHPLKLPDRTTFPRLEPIIAIFETIASQTANPPEEAVAGSLGMKSLDSCRKWLLSTWLEEYVHQALQEVAKLDDRVVDVYTSTSFYPQFGRRDQATERKLKDLELDVALMLGHQLYAVSCIASEQEEGNTKKHLFEAYVRARQLGGDEARAALVCLAPDSSAIRDEIDRVWETEGKIQVFGRKDLLQLTRAMQKWISMGNT